MKRIKQPMDSLVASLMPDSDKKMGAVAGFSFLVAMLLCFWATTYDAIIEDVIWEKTPVEDFSTTLDITEKKEVKEKKTEKKKNQKVTKSSKRPGPKKTRGRGNPRSPSSRGIIKMLAAQTNNASAGAYTLMREKFAKDIDKVIKNTNGLQVTGKTSIGAVRGKVDGGFNEGSFAGGSGGIEGAIGSLIGNGGGALSTKALGNLKTPSDRDIDIGTPHASRSATDILKVVRQRTPGLRHIYNKYLKKNPGFQGKVTLNFTIAPGGEVIRIAVVSSTTGYGEFDSEIKRAVGRWKFSKVKSGNTTVTIPFTFTE